MWRMLKWERKLYWLDGGGADGGTGGVSDAEATAFAESQGVIGLGSLGLTAGQLAGETASGVAASFSGPSPSPPGEGMGEKIEPPKSMVLEEKKAAVEGEVKETKKKRRPGLLTQAGGLLSSSGIRKSLIAG